VKMRQNKRADKVRSRLNQESQQSIRQAKKRVIEAPSMTISENSFTPLGEALVGSESAVRRRLRPGWRLISFLLACIFIYLLATAWRSPEYRVSEIQITGVQRLNQENIISTTPLIGIHIFAIDPEKIQSEIISQFPELRDVLVHVFLPAQVEIQVIERQPIIAWESVHKKIWIDTEGYLIPVRGETGEILTIQADTLPAYSLKSPIIHTGTTKIIRDKGELKPNPSSLAFFALPKQIDSGLLSAILQLNAWMPQEYKLLFQKVRGLGWRDVRGWDVFIGQKLEMINEKMVMYQTIIRELEDTGISPTLVSVEFLHAPYYRTD